MLNGEHEKAPASMQMSMEYEPIIPIQVKYVETQSAKILRNPKTTPTINKSREKECELLLDSDVHQSARCPEELADASVTPPPTTGSPINLSPNKFQFDPNLSYAEKVAHEMIITEKIYLDNLKQIIDGFLDPVSNHPDLDISQENIDDLFINVEEIYNFNWILLKDMEECNYDPVKLAECFVVKQTGFGVYTRYCTHYPRSMEVLMEWTQREDTASFIKKQQETLSHTLPLCSFLLKPVQRILKYHLLLGNIAKHFKQSEDEEGFQIIQKALSAMTNVAKHINNMKRKHENAVHLQEIQSVLVEYEGPNLTTFGSLVLEDAFRLHGTKTDRYLFLFKKALLITKRRNDGTFTWKATIVHSNMMLADSVFREPLTFQVFPFDDRKMSYTFVARNMDTKQTWLLELKRRLLDSYDAAVPMKAKQIILGNSREDYEKENTDPESGPESVPNNTRKGDNQQRLQSTKESNKLNKGIENERRKAKEFEENSEEKSRASIDSSKSPLRRKLRVFKKRKFSKDLGKSHKRVSWSSDDNNEEPCVGGSEPPDPANEGVEKQNVTISNSLVPPTRNEESDSKLLQDIEEKNIEKEVAVVSLPQDGPALLVVSEENNQASEHHDLPGTILGESLPIKKRRLAKDREKSKSLPVGGFSYDTAEGERTLQQTRTQSMSKLHGHLTERHHLNLGCAKLHKQYGVVNLRENAETIRRRRSSDEGCVRVNSEVNNNVRDEVISKLADDTRVRQTMRCVSAAFSDVSPGFSPEKTPTSSTEHLTAPGDDFAVFEEGSHGDFTDPPLEGNETEKTDPQPEYFNNRQDTRNEDNEAAVYDHLQSTSDSPSNEDLYNNDLQSNYDKSSTLSDFYDDQDDDSLTNSVKETYQKVFILKRAYSEENLFSNCSLNDEDGDCSLTAGITSKSCTHFDLKRSPIVRSKSLGSSYARHLPNSHGLTFSVTPKKKIVIKDRLWETINEYPENHERSSLERDGLTVRRRKRRTGSRKSNRNSRKSWSIGDAASYENAEPQLKLSACVSLDIGDYRKVQNAEQKDETMPQVEDASTGETLSELPQGVAAARGNTQSQQRQGVAAARGETPSQQRQGVAAARGETPSQLPQGVAAARGETPSQQRQGVAAARGEKPSQQRQGVAAARGKTQSQQRQEITEKSVTKVEVALKRRGDQSKKRKSVVKVDANVSEVPRNINYLCVERFPTDEHVTSDDLTSEQTLEDCHGKLLDGAGSKVGKLSKYYSEFKPEDNKDKCKSGDAVKHVSKIKKRIEELKRKEHSVERAAIIPEATKAMVSEELNIHHIGDRIDELQQSTREERQTYRKLQNDSTGEQAAPNVKRLKNRLEETNLTDLCSHVYEVELGKQLQSRLCIKDRVDEIENLDGNENTDNACKVKKRVDEELRGCRHIKDRIDRLRKEKDKKVRNGRDITISDEAETTESLMSPRQNEELRTVVIKRGWVQQFVQKIETGS